MAAIFDCTTYSEIFCCGICHDSVAITETPAGELCYACTNPACMKVVSADCPEALAIISEVTLKLPTPRQLGRRIALRHLQVAA